MRTFAKRTLVVLRIVYTSFALLVGIGLAIAWVVTLWEGIEAAIDFAKCNATAQSGPAPTVESGSGPELTTVTNCYGIDGPDPLSFNSYGKLPVFSAAFLLIAVAAVGRRWAIARLPCWFLASFVTVPVVAGLFYDSWRSVFGFATSASVWLAIPIIGIFVGLRSPASSRTSLAVAALAAVASVSYLWRAIITARSPEAERAIETLRGGEMFYVDSVDLVSASIVGLGAAFALLIAAFASLRGNGRGLSPTLAFTMGLSFVGFLQALDLAFGLHEGGYVAYVIQEGAAFIACVTALAVSLMQRSVRSNGQRLSGKVGD